MFSNWYVPIKQKHNINYAFYVVLYWFCLILLILLTNKAPQNIFSIYEDRLMY